MDSFTLTLLVKELRARLRNSALERVQAVGPAQFLFKFRHGSLVVSVDDRHPTLWLLQQAKKRATEHISPLLLLLRKHLAGCRLSGLEQPDYDRIVRFRFTGYTEAGILKQYSVVVELIHRRANLYLLDADDRIIERFKIKPTEQQIANEFYVLPEQTGKLDPPLLTEAHFNKICESADSVRQALMQNVKGFGPRLAQEVDWRARQSTAYLAFAGVLDDLMNRPQPWLYAPTTLDLVQPGRLQWERDLILAPIRLQWPSEQAGLTATPFATMLEAVEIYEEWVSASRTFEEWQRTLVAAVHQKRKKTEKRLERIKQDMGQLGDYEKHRQWGELLLANLQQARRGEHGFLVTDYYAPDQPMMEIPADPRASIQQAAADYFALYRKHKRKAESLQQQMVELEAQLTRLSTIFHDVQSAITLEAMESHARDILGRSLAAQHESAAASKTRKIPGVHQFLSSEQHQIWVGRTAEANQRLTFQIARAHDIWLHAADYPGSHVILRCNKGASTPFQSLVEAAQLAAFYSQARASGKVVVHYTERKYVHKIPGAAPGLVRLADFKSITVEPRVQATRVDV